MRAPRISNGHVIWAYADHISDMRTLRKMSVEQIRAELREDCHLRVGTEAIRAVLATYERRS